MGIIMFQSVNRNLNMTLSQQELYLHGCHSEALDVAKKRNASAWVQTMAPKAE